MLLLFGLVLISSALVYWYHARTYNFWKRKGVPSLKPKTFAGSFLSNLLQRKSLAEVVQDHYNAFTDKRYFGIYQFTLPTLVLKDMDLIKTITVKDFNNFIDHANATNEELDPVWSKNLLALVGEKWRNARATLSPAFTGSKMRFMFGLINDASAEFVAYFVEQKERIVERDMKDVFSRVANDVLASCAFGVRVDSLRDPENDFFVNGRHTFDFSGFAQMIFFMFSATPRLMKLLGLQLFSARSTAFLRSVILESIRARERDGLVRPDMVHLMLAARRGTLVDDDGESGIAEVRGKHVDLTDDDIVAQAVLFHFGGFEPTSSVLMCIAYELAVNPQVQTRLHTEVQNAWSEVGDGVVTYERVMRLEYMGLVIAETLRKWPPLILADRRAAKPYTIPATHPGEVDVTLEEGTIIWIPTFALHHDPELFPDPQRFDPERFNEENKHKIPSFAYLPFSIGPRNCIAQRFALLTIRTILFHLLHEFEIVPVASSNIPFRLSPKHVNVACAGGLTLGFKRRLA